MNDLSQRFLGSGRPPAPPEDDPRPRARAHRPGPFGVLDIGSTKIVCFIGRVESDGVLRVLGAAHRQARGVRNGGIVDLDAAEQVIRKCVAEAENMADTHLRDVTVNLSCGAPESRLFNVQWPIGGRQVVASDLRRIVAEGRARAASEGREIIHNLPLTFAVDETGEISDPRGMYCEALSARLHVIDATTTALRNLTSCLARVDLAIAELVSAPLASGLSTLVADERELGATLIDMGGGTTGIAVFADNEVQHTAVLAVGGMHVTNDIARLLTTPISHAERLKTLYGNVETSPDDEREYLPVPQVGEEHGQIHKVPRSMVISIIRPRLEETFEMVRDRLQSAGLARDIGQRVVLTGGACQLPGAREMAARVLGRPVRLGRPLTLRGLPDIMSGPGMATAAGLLAFAGGAGRGLADLDLDAERPAGLLRRLIAFLRERV
jgi:cell division protein FtsA